MNYKEELKNLFIAIPPEWDAIRKILDNHRFTKEELAEIAYDATHNCFCEYQDAVDKFGLENVVAKDLSGYYILESLKLLLDHGLDSNVCVGTKNALWYTQYIELPNVGAAAMRLLLEHGGNPNIVLPDPDKTNYGPLEMSLLEDVDADVLEDAYDYGLDYVVQCWMVLAAFGKAFRDGTPAITMLNGNDIDILKNFELFDYSIEKVERPPWDRGHLELHIFNKATGEEVAKY